MITSLTLLLLSANGELAFHRREVASFPNGYQAAVADVNVDGRPDVLALSTRGNQVVWYE
jgi:hypothetical protein